MSFCCGTNLKTGSSKNVGREKGIFFGFSFPRQRKYRRRKNSFSTFNRFLRRKTPFRRISKMLLLDSLSNTFWASNETKFFDFSEKDDAWICCNAITILKFLLG